MMRSWACLTAAGSASRIDSRRLRTCSACGRVQSVACQFSSSSVTATLIRVFRYASASQDFRVRCGRRFGGSGIGRLGWRHAGSLRAGAGESGSVAHRNHRDPLRIIFGIPRSKRLASLSIEKHKLAEGWGGKSGGLPTGFLRAFLFCFTSLPKDSS
jgi:hypothetical protein